MVFVSIMTYLIQLLSDRPAIKPRLTNKQIIDGAFIDDVVKASQRMSSNTMPSDGEEDETVLPVASTKKHLSRSTAKAKINSAKGITKVIVFRYF